MDKDRAVELTNRVYKQTLLFPKKEPLRYKIREIADEILRKAIRGESKVEIEKDIEELNAYFEIVKWQNWVSYFDIIRIRDDYETIRNGLDKNDTAEIKLEEKPAGNDPEIDSRKKKIIGILKERESVQVKDIKDALPNVSKRTLRRDFDVLIKKGLVQRIGESNNTFYKLN